MRAELPWNVAGIPPEAREAARAAARREGLSVGEWLTRRILRSFSDMGEEPVPFERSPALDSWGLPPSAAARRDSEEMLARVSRSETESNDSWRRIEEQLRGVARRLDSSERSQSENNRVLSKTAAEINIAAREQAQVFDLVGQNVTAINERLERLERDKATDGIKDAVKALHQGLSRVADQITHTASASATQVTTLTQSLEQLAARLGQVRSESENNHNALERRIEDGDQALEQRVSQVDQRIAQVEKATQFTTNALDHTLEKLEGQANQRATDQVEWQRKLGVTEESLQRLDDSISRLERAGSDPGLERRLDGIENKLHGLTIKLEDDNPLAPVEDTLHQLTRRLDALEKNHGDLMNEMRANIVAGPSPIYAPPQAPESPPFAEAPSPAGFGAFAEPPDTHYADSTPFLPPYGTDAFSPDAFAAGQFTAPSTEESDDPFAPLGEMVEPEGQPENFLSAARRSARAAAEKTEAEKSRLGRFGLGARSTEGKTRSKLLWPLVAVLAIAVVAVGAVLWSQRLQHRAPVEAVQTAAAPPLPEDNRPFTNAPLVGTPQAGSPAPHLDAPQETTQQQQMPQASVPKRAAAPAQQQAAAADRVAQLANNGNAIAQTIIGIRNLDGTDGTAANPAEALKWLTKAAEQGQAVAQYRLGTLYELGKGVGANPTTAAHWYQLAANQGNRKGMHNLGNIFATGALGKPNMPEAARWFAKAAGLGLVDSQFNLAALYERGEGVPQSLLDAFKWYSIAAAAGDAESKTRVEVLSKQLSDVDRAAAQRSAASFHPAALARSANVPPEPADLPSN